MQESELKTRVSVHRAAQSSGMFRKQFCEMVLRLSHTYFNYDLWAQAFRPRYEMRPCFNGHRQLTRSVN